MKAEPFLNNVGELFHSQGLEIDFYWNVLLDQVVAESLFSFVRYIQIANDLVSKLF